MNPGLLILVLAVVVAVGFGLHRRRVDGRFAGAPAAPAQPAEETVWTSVAAALPEAELGERATLVQFSSAFCAPCRTTRVVLADVAERYDGVAHLEIDAEQHLDLVRELDVRRTPTTLILDPAGRELTRAAGAPRREQVLAALPTSEETR
ncbi:TlpA family protein disulfide reductase [Nocardioides sp. LML1-1-1.1]|uniref:TlpA family protein disulfide reductase n=1 Tax=Nocardioides sp. LML1-1-1.1 TaxID=3135248 RepID=UPI00342A8477